MINHVTVIGSGLMGAGIAAHLTNAGVNVLLLDIPDVSSKNRNNFADQAVKKLPKIKERTKNEININNKIYKILYLFFDKNKITPSKI